MPATPRRLVTILAVLGPGLAMAATGVGAGDVTTTALGGARFGLSLLWVPILAAVFKFSLNEGLARWQLATNETVLEGWALKMGPVIGYGFLIYLIGWTIPVFATSMSGSGLAMNLLLPLEDYWPQLGNRISENGPKIANVTWAVILNIIVFLLVFFGRYQIFEAIMSLCILIMTPITLVAAILLWPSRAAWLAAVAPGSFDLQSVSLMLSIMAGVGGTITILSYSYWMRERRRTGEERLSMTRMDLSACYLVSGLFGVFMIILAGGVSQHDWSELLGRSIETGSLSLSDTFVGIRSRLAASEVLGPRIGQAFGTVFSIALLATVLSSLLGIMQGITYLFVDYYAILSRLPASERERITRQDSRVYKSFLVLLAVVPLSLVAWKRPTEIVLIYAVYSSFFMPFMACTLLYMNNRTDWVGSLKNRWLSNITLVACVLVFGAATMISLYRVITSFQG